MEKRKNGYFKAVGILSFIMGGFYGLDALSFFGEITDGFYLDGMEDLATILGVFTLSIAVYAIIQGSFFIKYSALTNEEASRKYKNCIAWTVCSFVFTGALNGILAILGLTNVIKAQKEEYEGVRPSSNQNSQTEQRELSAEELDKAKDKLEKLNELKISGGITDEEYNRMRAKIMQEINPSNKPQMFVDLDADRLAKLQELRSSGAITEEEFNTLKNRILNKK